MKYAERHHAPVWFYNDAYVATCQAWQTQIVTGGSTLSMAMKNKASWVAFWVYPCPGCPECPGWFMVSDADCDSTSVPGSDASSSNDTLLYSAEEVQEMVDLSVPQVDVNNVSSGSVGGMRTLRDERRLVQNAFYKYMKRFSRAQGVVRSKHGTSSVGSVGVSGLQGKEVRKSSFIKSKGGGKNGRSKSTGVNGCGKTGSIEGKGKSKNWY